MKIREISRLKLDDYYWRLVFGKSRHRISFFELRSSGFEGVPSPVFFLSTGRCGTNWFTLLFSYDKSIRAFHEPRPNFGVQGKVAYDIYARTGFKPTPTEEQLLEELFLTGREQHIRYSYKTQRRLLETNNQLTFLAPAIFRLFPETRFVHLNRHPGEFVRSAMRRGFYNNSDDIKRIVPVGNDPYSNSWEGFSLLEKNCWLWQATNSFIREFTTGLPREHHTYFDLNRLSEENIRKLCDFLQVDIPSRILRKMLGTRVNVQQTGARQGYREWPEEEKAVVRRICGTMAGEYGYEL